MRDDELCEPLAISHSTFIRYAVKWIRSFLNFTRQSSHETLGTLSVRLLCLVWQETRLHLIQFTQWVMRIVFSGNSRRTTIEGRVHGETIHRWLRQLLDDYCYPLFSISHWIIWNVLSGFAFVSFISKKRKKTIEKYFACANSENEHNKWQLLMMVSTTKNKENKKKNLLPDKSHHFMKVRCRVAR